MRAFGRVVRKLDKFGERVSINYGGESTYNSVWGGALSFIQWSLLLVVAVIGLIDLLNFEDPNVTQVSSGRDKITKF